MARHLHAKAPDNLHARGSIMKLPEQSRGGADLRVSVKSEIVGHVPRQEGKNLAASFIDTEEARHTGKANALKMQQAFPLQRSFAHKRSPHRVANAHHTLRRATSGEWLTVHDRVIQH